MKETQHFHFPMQRDMFCSKSVKVICNCDLLKVSKVITADSFNLPKVRKMIKVTCPKFIKVTSNLLEFMLTQRLDFMA